jgi:hypothetical protein
MRETGEELAQLLSQEQAAAVELSQLYSSFAPLRVLHVSAYSLPAWAGAVEEYEMRIAVVEQQVIQKIRDKCGESLQDG